MPKYVTTGFFLAFTCAAFLPQQPAGVANPPYFDNRKTFAEVHVNLQTLKHIVQQVDPAKLGVNYSEGRLIEGEQTIVLKKVDDLEKSIAAQSSRQPSLESTVEFVFDLKDLHNDLNLLGGSLSNLVTLTESDLQKQGLAWSEQIIASQKTLSNLESQLEMRARFTLLAADKMLVSCGQRATEK